METEEVIKLINEYFDGELSKEKEVFLFTSLSQNEGGRKYFKKLNVLRNVITEDGEEVPFELEERIFHSIDKSTDKKIFTPRNIFTFGSYALAIILIIVSIFLFNEINQYKKEVDEALKIAKAKNETVELLLNNTLPVTEVRGNFMPTNKPYLNEIIIKGKL